MRQLLLLSVLGYGCGEALPTARVAANPKLDPTTRDADPGDGEDDTGDSGTDDESEPFAYTCADFNFSPCGGDIVGDWTAQAVSPSTTPVVDHPSCTDSTMSIDATNLQVQRNFAADGTYTAAASSVLPVSANVTEACVQAYAGGLLTLQDACNILPLRVQLPEGSTLDCAVTADECLCSGTAVVELDEQGTYTTSGTKLTMSGAATPTEYCVDTEKGVLLATDGLIQIPGVFVVYD